VPSPFPGMNPYLEQEDVWHDFHERFMPAAAEMLLPQVRPNYIIKLDEHAYIHELPADQRRLAGRPDVSVVQARSNRPTGSPQASAAAPIYGELPLAVDVERHAFVEIRDRQTREVVTVLELLSPSNKRPGADREAYLAKRLEFLRSPAHFVEIDLLRGGPRLPVEGLPPCDYCAIVSRSDERPRVGIWPFRLADPLPRIPVPLRHPDPDAVLDLRSLLDRVYDAAGYEDYIYSGAPQPPLNDPDSRWAAQFNPKSS
jgi:hypothetical protein